MPESSFPHGFDPTSSILFLGAGFTRGAENVVGEAPPLGLELAAKLKTLCGLPDHDQSGIQDLSRYAVDEGKDLLGTLRDLYTIKALNEDQKLILSKPWMRIYTTNYDDAVEFDSITYRKAKKLSYSFGETVPIQFRPEAVVHLHGYIHKVDSSNILHQLVLSHFSYAQQRATQSPWWQVFERDLRVAQNIFFVGYELSDFEPASYLSKNPAVTSRTHFILRPTNSPVAARRLQEYGTRHDMAVDGFAKECMLAQVGQKPAHANVLRAFRFFDLLKDDKLSPRPTPVEIEALFAFGNYNQKRLLATYPHPSYIAPRTESVNQAIAKLEQSKTLILHSKIGNGKTIFRHGFAMALSQLGHSCFEVRENITPPLAEIDFIRSQQKVVVFFPNYDTAYSLIHLFSDMKEDARFIVEMNTSTFQVRNNEIFARLVRPIERLDLNYLSDRDCREIFSLLDDAGIAPSQFESTFKVGAEFRDIVISIFENSSVVAKIDAVIKPLITNSEIKVVLLCSAILKAIGIDTDPSFVRSISNVDPFEVLGKAGESVLEFVDFRHDRVQPHSALFSEFLIRRYLPPHELVGALFRLAAEAARRMNEEANPQSERAREARSALGSLLRFSFLYDLLHGIEGRDEHIRLIYEHGRQDSYIQGEPLFWLQYSIFMQHSGRLDLAERHMATAYKRGENREGFLTYQLDTNTLGLLMLVEGQEAKAVPVKRATQILELLEKMRAFLHEGNHRGHVLKVLLEVERFVFSRRDGLNRSEAVAFTYQLTLLVQYLASLPVEERAYFGSDNVKASLERAVNSLTRE